MHRVYKKDPIAAVRGQAFIKILHRYLAAEFDNQLSPTARRNGIAIKEEVTIYGSHKPKTVDVAVIDPDNGPLLIAGVRSQMSSVAKNALTYYEGIIGECISLQDRFPLTTIGYVYLHPVRPVKEGREAEVIDYTRYALMYEGITGRSGKDYKSIRGVYDQFAYMLVDFGPNPPKLRDDLVAIAVPDTDLKVATFVNRMVTTFKRRSLFLTVFK